MDCVLAERPKVATPTEAFTVPAFRCIALGENVTRSPFEEVWCRVRAIDGVARIACCRLRGALANVVEELEVGVAAVVRTTPVGTLISAAEPTTRRLTNSPIAAALIS
jgi:hypothetical protein